MANNSKRPPVTTNEQKFEALPKEDILNVPASTETEEEKLKRLEREAEINKTTPTPETVTGPDTTGVGQPSLQPVTQGNSLPPSAIPVEKKFSRTDTFYDPMETERALAKKERADAGAKKTEQ